MAVFMLIYLLLLFSYLLNVCLLFSIDIIDKYVGYSLSFLSCRRKSGSFLQQASNSGDYGQSALSIDYGFAQRLRQVQTDDSYPLVNDIIVSRNKNKILIFVIMNNGNTRGGRRYNRDVHVTLSMGNNSFGNLFGSPFESQIRLLKYKVDQLPSEGVISLTDHSTGLQYNNLPYREVPVLSNKRRVAVCAYISSYNSIAEIRHWIAYYMLQKVDNVILYCAEPINEYVNVFHKSIESGFLILYHYPWPLTHAFGPYQRSIQVSQINSCYYRHRGLFEYIISQDVDEYFYSEQYPFDLYDGIKKAFILNHSAKSLQIASRIHVGGTDRKESLQKGTLFKDYDSRLDFLSSGRQKLVISTKDEGWYSIHWCYFCKQAKNQYHNVLQIAHFKQNVRGNNNTEQVSSLVKYVPDLQQLLESV